MKKTLYILATISLVLHSCSKDPAEETPPTPANKVPGEASLIAPENNKACETVNEAGQILLSWGVATDTDSYDLKITNLNTQGVTNHNNITSTSKAVSLAKGVPYSWSITSKNEGDQTTSSATWKFYLAGDATANYAPFPATAVSPLPGATASPAQAKVTIAWSGSDADNDGLTYTLEADTTDGLQGTKVMENSAATSFDLTVQNNTVYYWRVISSDGEHSSTSIVYSFRTSN